MANILIYFRIFIFVTFNFDVISPFQSFFLFICMSYISQIWQYAAYIVFRSFLITLNEDYFPVLYIFSDNMILP